jgi:transposase
VVAECYLVRVSTRRVEGLAETLGIQSLSTSQVSELATSLDAAVAAFRTRPLDAGPYPYVWLDALAVRCRDAHRIVNVSETTIRKGLLELDADQGPLPLGRARRPGGGRKRAEDNDPGLVAALLGLVEPDERGDPMSPLRWTTKSLGHVATELVRQGHAVSASTVGRLLREQGFSLQGTAKTLEGAQHPDRDAQFGYIYEQAKAQQADGEPVISVDAKKKEMLG